MEGVSKEFNKIYQELVADHLLRAMRSTQNASALKFQLTSRLLFQLHGGCGAAIAHRWDLLGRVLSR